MRAGQVTPERWMNLENRCPGRTRSHWRRTEVAHSAPVTIERGFASRPRWRADLEERNRHDWGLPRPQLRSSRPRWRADLEERNRHDWGLPRPQLRSSRPRWQADLEERNRH